MGTGAGGSILFLGNAINENTGTPINDSNVCAKVEYIGVQDIIMDLKVV